MVLCFANEAATRKLLFIEPSRQAEENRLGKTFCSSSYGAAARRVRRGRLAVRQYCEHGVATAARRIAEVTAAVCCALIVPIFKVRTIWLLLQIALAPSSLFIAT